MDINYTQAVAQAVQARMDAQAFTQAGLAEATGIPRVTLIRRLRGFVPFTVRELHLVATALDIPVTDLMPAVEDVA